MPAMHGLCGVLLLLIPKMYHNACTRTLSTHSCFSTTLRSCRRYVLKTNEDSFVRLDRLPAFVADLPPQGLLFGRIGGAGNKAAQLAKSSTLPVDRDGFPIAPKKQLPYPNGCGYLVSVDVAKNIARPPFHPVPTGLTEDQLLGLVLHYSVVTTVIHAKSKVQPLGKCTEDVLVLHYQRHTPMMRRRYDRAARGANVCGKGFPKHMVCVRAGAQKTTEVKCPRGSVVRKVIHAAYAKVDKRELVYPYCKEDPESVIDLSDCKSPDSRRVAERLCLGRARCTIAATPTQFGGDPCRGSKHFYGLFECGAQNPVRKSELA